MKKQPRALYEIVGKMNPEELELFCENLEVDYYDLGGSSRKIKALNLQKYLDNRSRIHELIAALHLEFPQEDLSPYLHYVIAEQFSTVEQIVSLLEGFGITARDFGGKEKYAWGSEPWREQKAWALQNYMEDNGRSGDLIQAILQKNEHIDLSFYLDVKDVDLQPEKQQGQNKPDGTKDNVQEPSVSTQDEYMNFDLNITKIGDKYQIEVSDSPNGQEKAFADFDLNDRDLKSNLMFLSKLRARPTDVEDIGDKLARFLFPPDIANHLNLSLREANNNNKNLRIRLRLDLDQPDLSQIPWEYCRIRRKFVAQSIETPIVRYLKTNQPDYRPLTIEKPVRLLLVTASPVDEKWKQLEVEKEVEAIKTAVKPLEEAGKVVVDELYNASPRDLVTKIRRTFRPHILHFIGHGTLQENGEGALVLEDGSPERKPRLVDVDDISQLLDASDVSLVVLSACETAAHDASDAIMGIAPRLVWEGMPAVIAMQYPVPDQTAILFATELYTFLTDFYPLDKAVTEARITTYFTSKDKAYWGIPVLFLRAADGVLWQSPAA
jgi:hypothetical protein